MPDTPRDVLARYHRAVLDASADDLADLYAPDGVHHIPFYAPGLPGRFDGREQIRAGYREAWADHPVRPTGIREVVVHPAADPEVIFGEFALTGTVRATGEPFELGGVLMLRVRDGLIVEARDYIDALAVTTQLSRGSRPVGPADAC